LFTTRLTETQLASLLSAPEVSHRAGLHLGPDASAVALSSRGRAFEVTAAGSSYIVRLPRDHAHLVSLRQEARIAAALQGRISLHFPDTRVVEGLSGVPTLAIHTKIPGEPLVTDNYTNSSPAARERLVSDLARFFQQMHAIPLDQAAEWLGLECLSDDPATELAPALGKPLWFDPRAVEAMRPGLAPVLDDVTWPVFEHTVAVYQALDARPEYMVFGHGDLHGYNAAVVRDELGPRLVGAFDLENTGILDLHEDFFRLSLVSEEMLDHVLAAYQRLQGPTRPLDRARIAVYYRAFLFYLMVGKSGERWDHLHRLLAKHQTYYRTHHGGLDAF
jgi:aminoglycoside phosphotransferase (APT) family kinase protein